MILFVEFFWALLDKLNKTKIVLEYKKSYYISAEMSDIGHVNVSSQCLFDSSFLPLNPNEGLEINGKGVMWSYLILKPIELPFQRDFRENYSTKFEKHGWVCYRDFLFLSIVLDLYIIK